MSMQPLPSVDLAANIVRFYDFIAERESIRRRRLAGLPREEWTSDPVFRQYSFTNVKRIHDRTTIGMKRLYDNAETVRRFRTAFMGCPPRLTPPDGFYDWARQIMLNCMLYRYFGTVGMAEAIGWVTEWSDAEKQRICTLADDRSLLGKDVFTPAYIVPNAGSTMPKREIVCEIARQLWDVLQGDPAKSPIASMRWEIMCLRLCRIWGFGPFMAKEVTLDYFMATGVLPNDWEEWTPVGPGAIRGATRVFRGNLDSGKLDQDGALSVCRTIWQWRNEYWPFQKEMPLDLTDVQFQLCEFDKMSRVADGKRPKRNFRPTIDEVTREPRVCDSCKDDLVKELTP